MDTDIIFLKRPNELIDWIGSENKTLKPLYNIDRYDTLRDAEERLKKEFSITQFCPNFNAGFICMTNNVTKEEIEKMLLINKNYRDTKITKGDQTIYHVMLTRRGAEPLPSRLYNIFNGKTYPNEAKMIHLPTHVRFKKGVYLKLTRKLCRQLKRKNN
jgi:lipopolysaccharide biosynthesis glycosyltransferase